MIAKHTEGYGDHAYVVVRVIVGLLFALHGAQKFGWFGEMTVAGFAGNFGLPVSVAFLVAAVELIGGIGIAVGFFTRLSAVGIAVVMVGALSMAHFPQGLNPLANGGEKALAYLAISMIFAVHGARRWSLEKKVLDKEMF